MTIRHSIEKGRATILFFCLTALISSNAPAAAQSSLDISPVRITLNSEGSLLVSDYTYGMVLTVNPVTMDVVSQFVINGRPLGIAWANDLIYVGNSSTGQVEVYNDLGSRQFVLGHGSVPVAIPQDIAVSGGKVLVVDGADRLVKIFDLDGSFAATIPVEADSALLANPTAIAVDDKTGRIFISDYGNADNPPRIQVFDAAGTLVRTIDNTTAGRSRFSMPQGIIVNDQGHLFVVDALSSRILVYDTETGNLLHKVRSRGRKTHGSSLQRPLDLVIGPVSGDLFVTNSRKAGIKVYAKAGER